MQLHTAIEDLLDVWLKSYLLGVPAEMRNKAARSRRMTARAIDDLLTGGSSIGFDRKLKLLLALRLLRQPTCKKLNELRVFAELSCMARLLSLRIDFIDIPPDRAEAFAGDLFERRGIDDLHLRPACTPLTAVN